MLKSFVAASCFVSLVACVQQDKAPDRIGRALPQADTVSIKLPDATARSANARTIGQLANWYVATRDVTRTFNGGTGWVLVLLHTIVQFPVTTVHDNTYTWGPWSDSLSPAEYKLDVRELDDATYTYQLSGRSKTQANAQFQVVIDGKADPRKGDLQGNGQFLLDFDAGRAVNPIDAGDAKGTLDVRYDLAARHLDLTIMSTDALGQPTLADYAYNDTADGAGDMVFALSGNAGGGAALESVTLRSRWQADGEGRADARIGGGDLGAVQATASECWGKLFQRVYYTDSVGFAPTEGQLASCAFATSDLPQTK